MEDKILNLLTGYGNFDKTRCTKSGPYTSSRQRVRDQDIVPVRLHTHDVGEKLVPPYWRSENCHTTPRVF